MKIGIACYPTYGGSGIVATELGKHLADAGHEIHFFSYEQPFRLSEFYENVIFHEIVVPNYPLFKYPPYALALATEMAEVSIREKLDILHVHYAIPHAISAYLSREMIRDIHPVKVVTTLHGTDITLVGVDPAFMRITRFGIDNSDAVTAVSRYLKGKTEEIFTPQQPISVIYNFIEEHPLQQKVCDHLRQRLAPNNEFILMHLSNFRPVKRVVDVVEIAHRVRQKLPIQLVFVGDGPDRPLAERRCRELGMEKVVHFLGKQENIYPILSVADVFLMPSIQESFGLAALEAMSCGVPCVTSDAGGLPEIMREGVTGYVVPAGQLDEMAERVIRILTEPGLLDRLRKSAREFAFDNFHVSKILPQYLNLYQQLIDAD